MRKAAILLVAVILFSATATAVSVYGVNGSEPRFLDDVGPQEQRTDNPVAAAVVAVAVTAAILRGLHAARG